MERGGESTGAGRSDARQLGGDRSGEGRRPPVLIDVARQDRSFAFRLDRRTSGG
jgi:hypothetical protein